MSEPLQIYRESQQISEELWDDRDVAGGAAVSFTAERYLPPMDSSVEYGWSLECYRCASEALEIAIVSALLGGDANA